MNTLLLIFLAPFLTSTAVGQVESVQIQSSFFETTALKFYCRYGSLLNEDVSRCTPKEVVQEQTVQEKVVEVVRNVFVPVAQAEQPSDSYLESMIRRIVLELLPAPQTIVVKGEKGDKGDPGTSGSNLLAFDGIQMPFWSGYGSGPTGGGATVVNNVTNIFGSSSTSTVTANNGLTINPANNVQLGGLLVQDTLIDLGTTTLSFNQTSTSSRFKISGASGYSAGFSTQDIFQVEHYTNEGFAISSYEQGPLITDPHGTFLNFTDNLSNPLFSPNGAYLYSDQTSGQIGMGRWAGGQFFITPSSIDMLSPGSISISAQGDMTTVAQGYITTTSDEDQYFSANNSNSLLPTSSGYVFYVTNATGNDVAVANFNGGTGSGADMFVGQFDPNGQYTADPGSFYYNMSPVDDNDVMWVKGPTGGFGSNTGWVPVQTGTSSAVTAWLLTGNSGTDPLNNFVGTVDAQDLVLRTNNSEVARFGQVNNFSFGYGAQALSSNMNVMGNNAGTAANNAPNSNFFGIEAGASATNASMANFFGFYAGNNATNAATSNFIGASAGNGATNAATSNFIGDSAGFNATDATFSNFIGYRAGFVSANASNSNFIGKEAGSGAINANNANFIGQMAGLGATNAEISNFIGLRSGLGATDAYRSNFLGFFAGQGAVSANNSNFFGESAGQDALNANNSNFFGSAAGQNATNANNSNFFGKNAGNGAIGAENSNFIGQNAGVGATNVRYSNFFGLDAGSGATDAGSSNFFGWNAGLSASLANDSNFFGNNAGNGATNAANSNFFGNTAGESATDAPNSNFFGTGAGQVATFAANSNFFGFNSGNGATNANDANFFGTGAGVGATNASNSIFIGGFAGGSAVNASAAVFIGQGAGESATNATRAIFIGQNAGNGDTVNNTISGNSILIGVNTRTGGFKDSIALGASARNTAANQFMLGATTTASVSINEMYLGKNSTNAFPLIYANLTGVGIGTTTPTEKLSVAGNVRFSGALMPNNLSGATGTVLMSQGAGLAPVWTGTSSLGLLNHWQKNTNVLSPNDAAVYQIAVTNNSASTLTGFKTTNTNDVSNYAGAVMELKGSGADFTNNVYFGKYGSAFYIPSWAGNGVLATDKSLVLGALGNSSNIDFQVGGGYVAPVTKMTLSSTTLRLISANFRLDGAFMPNNLAGATGTLLMSQGNGLAPVWMATSSLNLSISSSTIASNFGFIQNGNSFGTTATLGTNDNFDLALETVNTPRITINTLGGVNVAGETGGGGAYTMNVAANVSSNAFRITGSADTIYAQQGAGANVFFIRTAGANTHLTASAGNSLILGVGGTTQNDFNINSSGDTTVRHRLYVADSFSGSGVARIGQTIQSATNSGNQTGATTQLLIQPDDGGLDSTGTNIGLNVNMGSLSGGTNYAAVFQNGNVGIGTTVPTERLEVSGNIRFSGALMPNNLSGATGTVLMSQGAGLAPVWTGTSSLGFLTTSLPFSGLTNATGTNTLNNTSFAQTWNWSALGASDGLTLSGTQSAQTGSILIASSNSTGALANGAVHFNFTGTHTGNGFQIDDVTTAGIVTQINANSILGGTGLNINANALTSGQALYISTTNVAQTGQSLSVLNGSTGNLASGGVKFNFTGAHTGQGVEINDVTQTGNAMAISPTALTTGTGLFINSTNAAQTGRALRVQSNSTGAVTNGLAHFSFTGTHTGNGLQVDDITTTGNAMKINATALTTGSGLMIDAGTANNNIYVTFDDAGTVQGSITNAAGAAVLYNTTSDARLKENVQDTNKGLVDLMKIQVKDYSFISDINHEVQTGFLAQDLIQIFPDAVSTNGDDGMTVLTPGARAWGVDYGRITPLVVKSIQELDVKIEDLAGGEDMPLTVLVNGVEEKTFVGKLFTRMTEWFADAGNGIKEFFAKRVVTEELCISDPNESFCITKDELKALKGLIGSMEASVVQPPEHDDSIVGDVVLDSGSSTSSPEVVSEDVSDVGQPEVPVLEEVEPESTPEALPGIVSPIEVPEVIEAVQE